MCCGVRRSQQGEVRVGVVMQGGGERGVQRVRAARHRQQRQHAHLAVLRALRARVASHAGHRRRAYLPILEDNISH